jgi:hypothetical protein
MNKLKTTNTEITWRKLLKSFVVPHDKHLDAIEMKTGHEEIKRLSERKMK